MSVVRFSPALFAAAALSCGPRITPLRNDQSIRPPTIRSTNESSRATAPSPAPSPAPTASSTATASAPRLETLPAAPEQTSPWHPADPGSLSRAAGWMFDHGLPDPRGLRYVEATVVVGDLWSGNEARASIRGWVFPRSPGASHEYVLGWSGGVYEAQSIDGDADLVADLRRVSLPTGRLTATEIEQLRSAGPQEAIVLVPYRNAPVVTALAARLGASQPEWNRRSETEWRDALVFAVLANEYNRLACAQMRGDALTVVRAADRVLGLRDAYLAEPNLPPNTRERIGFVEPASQFRRDGLRRLARGAVRPSASSEPPASPEPADPASRARALLAEFDEIDARQWGQPGGVVLAMDPHVRQMIEIGEPAVDLLLDALEHDDRLTRSVHFWRDFAPSRNPIAVYEAVYTALANILQTDFFQTYSTGDDLSAHGDSPRRELAARIRAHWQRIRSLSPTDRLFAVLANDTADASLWVQAAEHIVRDASAVASQHGSMFGGAWNFVQVSPPPPPPTQLAGDPLRSRRSPSVSDLFARRAISLIEPAPSGARADTPYARFESACALTGALVEWEPNERAHLTDIVEHWIRTAQSDEGYRLDSCLARAIVALDRVDAPGALQRYLEWVVSLETPREDVGDILSMAARHIDDARVLVWTERVVRVGGWLPRNEFPEWWHGIDRTALPRIPAVRRALEASLRDRSRIGSVTIRADGGYRIESRETTESGPGPEGEPFDVGVRAWRHCDDVARQILRTGLWEASTFPFRASIARRDAAIANLIERIQQAASPHPGVGSSSPPP